MFPFDLQAKMAEAWFGAAAAGFAAAGAIASQSPMPWLPRPQPSALGYWFPAVTPTTSTWPWAPWLSGFGGGQSWWQLPSPLSFYGSDWTRMFTYGSHLSSWPMPYPNWTAAFPLAQPFAAFSFFTPLARPTPTLPYFPTPTETAAMFAASYRTATGHATAAMFDAMTPRPTGWSDSAWKMTPMSIFAL